MTIQWKQAQVTACVYGVHVGRQTFGVVEKASLLRKAPIVYHFCEAAEAVEETSQSHDEALVMATSKGLEILVAAAIRL